ncbi:MAG: MtrB/PioB family outer membrane beta-barrel protein, partial [Acidobacteria bacterium]|nr:MtrB/PioB family outer membrane beta-barrel protein [Acidobacteriota bacterium]
DNSSRLHEVSAIARWNLTKNLMPKIEYRFQLSHYKDFQTSIMNPYAYVGAAIDPAGTTGLQRMLFLGADTPGYRAHVITVTLEYRF